MLPILDCPCNTFCLDTQLCTHAIDLAQLLAIAIAIAIAVCLPGMQLPRAVSLIPLVSEVNSPNMLELDAWVYLLTLALQSLQLQIYRRWEVRLR